MKLVISAILVLLLIGNVIGCGLTRCIDIHLDADVDQEDEKEDIEIPPASGSLALVFDGWIENFHDSDEARNDIVKLSVSFECVEEIIEIGSGKKGKHAFASGIGFVVENKDQFYVISVGHLLAPWMYWNHHHANFNETNCKVSDQVQLEFRGVNFGISLEFVSNSTPGISNGNDVVVGKLSNLEGKFLEERGLLPLELDNEEKQSEEFPCQIETLVTKQPTDESLIDRDTGVQVKVSEEDMRLTFKRNDGYIKILGNCQRLAGDFGQHDVPATRGMSGSPILNDHGKVVGIHLGHNYGSNRYLPNNFALICNHNLAEALDLTCVE
eukprot:TRINITY_DN779832_c0_g1_i1.p1 TRINITY_DN779832_c0_g1~~TRINITY_DN779832_c0_g1_i1.p1  ORF type:complete len:326 (+),score=81.69 TRINITY_DN779832_c0_g1_i1:108-1085(+)